MTKPVSPVRWADLGTRTAPNSGRRDVGFEPGDRPTAEELNSLIGELGDWSAYLNGQDFAGDVKVAGVYRRTTALTRKVPPCMALGIDGTVLRGVTTGQAVMTTSTAKVHYPIVLQEGERLTSVRVRVAEAAAGDVITMKVLKLVCTSDAGGYTTTQLGATQSSTGATSRETLTVSGLTETADTAFTSYVAEIALSSFSAGGNVDLLTFTTDVP